MGIIFDLDQTIIDSRIALEARRNREWQTVYNLIPQMTPYTEVIELIHALVNLGIEVAVVTSSPRPYCERVLNYFRVTGVITVCYHDTPGHHKPDPEPYLYAIKQMRDQQGRRIIAVGDEKNDITAAHAANIECALAYWGNDYYDNYSTVRPTLFCRDVESLVRYFHAQGVNVGIGGLRQRNYHTYQLYDYYPMSKTHDMLSIQIFEEVKNRNNSVILCDAFCREFEETVRNISPNTYGIFVVPSSTKGEWNRKLTDYVVPKLVRSCGLIDCSKYIQRHITHDKQAFGGDRSVQSNLSTIRLQYNLPPQMKGAFIIDDIITTGNIFDACKQLLFNEDIDNTNIYCAAIGGTI